MAEELAPIVVIPMHYRGEGFGYDVIGPLEQFTALRSDVSTCPGGQLELSPETSKQTAVLKPMNM